MSKRFCLEIISILKYEIEIKSHPVSGVRSQLKTIGGVTTELAEGRGSSLEPKLVARFVENREKIVCKVSDHFHVCKISPKLKTRVQQHYSRSETRLGGGGGDDASLAPLDPDQTNVFSITDGIPYSGKPS